MANAKSSTPSKDAKNSTYLSRFPVSFHDPLGIGTSASSVNTSPQITDDDLVSLPAPTQLSSPMQETTRFGRRGRRRRSSELEQSSYGQGEVNNGLDSDNQNEAPAASNLLWWQRPRNDDGEEEGRLSNEAQRSKGPPPIDTATKEEVSSSPSPSLRSPAAAFLSSMNETLGSPSSLSGSLYDSSRAYSTSPNRGHTYGGPSIPDISFASLPRNHSHHGSEGSPFGLASAAARLYNTVQPSNSQGEFSQSRPDEEGSRIGPNGRYLMGKTIGFGGFSTIREAWDLGSVAKDEEVRLDKGGMHRVAVKIVYSQEEEKEEDAAAQEEDELRVWGLIPSHPNLLPLLHHERIVTSEAPPSTNHSSISFLVMPFCEGSLLAFVKSEGQLPTSSTMDAPGTSSLSRSASLQSAQGMTQQFVDTPSVLPNTQQTYPRTGSGFVHRSIGTSNRVASVPFSNVLGRSPSLATSPASVGTSSSILRRASSRISRTQPQSHGVPLSAAQDVMKQLTEALICLHSKASVLHGDLKLENVLGQRSVVRYLHSHHEESFSREETDSYGSDSMISLQHPQTSTIETICWRVADFGLAKRVDKHSFQFDSSNTSAAIFGGSVGIKEKSSKAKKSKTKSSSASAGGSLAYTAPETFLPATLNRGGGTNEVDESKSSSPFASDMWALGCILYALCSGKLPFSDSFEPRLQMKIAKGKWDMPNRLKRREERILLPSKAATTDTRSTTGVPEREREQSSNGNVVSNRNDSLSASLRSTKPSSPHHSGGSSSMTMMDMSASMPALQQTRFFENRGRSTSDTSVIVHDANESFEEMKEEEEENMESDDDDRLDQSMDGKSKDRVEVRLALRKLLEPDPRKRWTIEQLANLSWISKASSSSVPIHGDDRSLLEALHNTDLSTNEEDGHRLNVTNRRPGLATTSISEHASQENVPSRNDEEEGRGRSKRREADDKPYVGSAKPIDIDRSTSRSRSRQRDVHLNSSPWDMASSSFERMLQQKRPSSRDGWGEISEKRYGKRSSSVDALSSQRGRSTSTGPNRSSSRPRQLDLTKSQLLSRNEISSNHNPSTGNNTESASRSSTSRSRSRARDALQDIASREGETRDESPSNSRQDGGEERLWWQRGRKGR